MLNGFSASANFGGGTPKGAGVNKRLASWHLSNGATAAVTVNFQDADSGALLFQVQLPVSASSSQAYPNPLYTKGGWNIVVTGGPLNAGALDLI